jgi:hypothetical protein
LIVEEKFHRASPGGTGGVKTIGNYASVTLWISNYGNSIKALGYLITYIVITV